MRGARGHGDPRSHSPVQASGLACRSGPVLPFGPPTRPHGRRAQSPRACHHVPVRNREKGQEVAAPEPAAAPRPARTGLKPEPVAVAPTGSQVDPAMQTRSEPCAPGALRLRPAPTRLAADSRATPRRSLQRTCPGRPARRPQAAPRPAPLTCRAACRFARSAAVAASRLPSFLALREPDQLFRSLARSLAPSRGPLPSCREAPGPLLPRLPGCATLRPPRPSAPPAVARSARLSAPPAAPRRAPHLTSPPPPRSDPRRGGAGAGARVLVATLGGCRT